VSLQDGECQSLGSRLRRIENATIDAVFNDALDFSVDDWVLEGAYYVINYSPAQHGSGNLPMIQAYEKQGAEYYSVSFDSIILQADGAFKIRVLSNPDLRFEGRLIVDE
jgi:hypothetical protein